MISVADPCVAVGILAGLKGMGPHRLDRLLQRYDPLTALAVIADGTAPPSVADVVLRREWQTSVTNADPAVVARRLAASAITVTYRGHPDHPPRLANDLDPAPVLFRRGRGLSGPEPKVAVIGTRRATGLGREVARELGFGLSAAGVRVVSGLAIGVDGAAHYGAVAAEGAAPLAVVGGGPDVIYPKRHAGLWASVINVGTLGSEAPPGAPPVAWRFPARNRLIAALADLVVVVESRAVGGSMLTVNEAIRRGREVMAVPGSVRNPAAVGTNRLISEGCAPVTSVDDVLVGLGLMGAVPTVPNEPLGVANPPSVPEHLRSVLDAVDDGPTSMEEICVRSDLPVVVLLAAIDELVSLDLVVRDGVRVCRSSPSGDQS